jgi:hypothetical protein
MKKKIRVHLQGSKSRFISQSPKRPNSGRHSETPPVPAWVEETMVSLHEAAGFQSVSEFIAGKVIYRKLRTLSQQCRVTTSDLLLATLWVILNKSEPFIFPPGYLLLNCRKVAKLIQAQRVQQSVKGGAQ